MKRLENFTAFLTKCLKCTNDETDESHEMQKNSNESISVIPNRSAPIAQKPKPKAEENVYVALYDFTANAADDLPFQKNDVILVTNTSDEHWWKGRNLRTNKQGYVPSNYIKKKSEVKEEEWDFGTLTRIEATKLLRRNDNVVGSYLVRTSDRSGGYVISVRGEGNPFADNTVIKHYKITSTPEGKFHLDKQSTMHDSLHDFVEFHKTKIAGIPILLTKICSRPRRQNDPIRELQDEYEVDRKEVHIHRVIGRGHFGCVSIGILKSQKVAIKEMNQGVMQPSEFLAEAALMKKLKHKNLVELIAVCSQDHPIYIITPYISNGDLLSYLRKDPFNFTMDILIEMCTDVAAGMKYIEEMAYIHRDLRAQNILVDENNVCKIADFGLSRVLNEDVYQGSEATKFPVKWTAPEAIEYKKFTIKSDIWSYGVLLSEIVTCGATPYSGMSGRETIEFIQGGERMKKPTKCPEEIYELMLMCWKTMPDDRPTFAFLFDYLKDFGTNKEKAYDERENI